MTRDDDLLQRAERWLLRKPTPIDATGHFGPMGACLEGAKLIQEFVAMLKEDTPVSTQRNPSPVDLPAPYWIAVYAIALPGDVTDKNDD